MPMGKDANARSQPAKGRPREQRRCQVAHRQPEEEPQGSPSQESSHHGITLPRVPDPQRIQPVFASEQLQMGSLGCRAVLPSPGGSRQEQTLGLPPLVTVAPRPPPRPRRAVYRCCRRPHPTPAASAASGNASNSAVGSASSNQRQLSRTAAHLSRVRSYGSRGARPESGQPALHRSKASAPTRKSSGSMSTALHRYSTGSQGPHQQPAARQDPAHSRAAEAQARTGAAPAANRSKAPATQPTLRTAERAAQHLKAKLAAGSRGSLKGKFMGLSQVFPQPLPPLPHVKTSERAKMGCLPAAPEKHRAPLPPIARGSHRSGRQEAAAQGQTQAPAPQTTKAMDAALQATAMSEEREPLVQSVGPEDFPGDKKEEANKELECASDKELSQGEAVTMHNICASPLVPELFQDAQAEIQAGSSIRSNVGTDATSEAAGDLQSVSPVLAGPTDTELAAPNVAAAAEEEQHRAPLASVAQEQEEAPAPPCAGFDEQEAGAEACGKSFALLSPTASELTRPERARCFVRDVQHKPLAVIHGSDEQALEQHHVGVPMAATRPAAVEDTEPPAAAELPAEPSTAPLVPAASEAGEDMVSTVSRDHQEEPVKAYVCTAAEEGKHHAPLAAEAKERKAPAQGCCASSEQEEQMEAQNMLLALLSPMTCGLIPEEDTRQFVREVIERTFTITEEKIRQRREEQDVAEAADVSMAARKQEARHLRTDRLGPGEAWRQGPVPSWSELPPQAHRQPPRRVPAVCRVFRRKAPEEPQEEASRTFASLRSYRDEHAAAQDIEEEPTTSSARGASRPGWWHRLRLSGSARASLPIEKTASFEWKLRTVPSWHAETHGFLLPAYPLYPNYNWETDNLNAGLRGTRAQEQQPSLFRRVWKGLSRASRCSCLSPQVEE